MKLFASTMAVLILLLSCMPCQDIASGCSVLADRQTSVASGNTAVNDHHDNCSPFCHCTCCAASSVHQAHTSFSCVSFTKDHTFASFISLKVVGIALPIWQPPQLS